MSNKIPDLSNLDLSNLDFSKTSVKQNSVNNNYDLITTVDGILEVLDDNFIQVLDKVGLIFDDIKGVKNWSDIGLDDYDQILLIMEIEKIYDCNILDVAAEKFMITQPSIVWNTIIEKRRDENISKIIGNTQ